MAPRHTPGQSTDPPSPLTEEQRQNVDMGLVMVQRCAAQIAGRYAGLVTPEELASTGAIALDEAARKYQKEQHPSFLHFAGHYVRGRMLDSLRIQRFSLRARVERAMERAFDQFARNQTLDVDLFAGSENELVESAHRGSAEVMAALFLVAHATAPQATPEEELMELEGRRLDAEAVRSVLVTLPPEEQRVLDLVYRENMTLAEVARETGVHFNTAQRRHASGLRTMRARLMREAPRLARERLSAQSPGGSPRSRGT